MKCCLGPAVLGQSGWWWWFWGTLGLPFTMLGGHMVPEINKGQGMCCATSVLKGYLFLVVVLAFAP